MNLGFEWPWALLGLLAIPLALVAYLLAERRRRATSGRFAAAGLLPGLVAAAPGLRRHLPWAVVLVALAALVVGAARPHATRSVQREDAVIVLVLDTSRSMAATDVRPSRLDAARAAVARFLERVPEAYRVGLVSFSTTAQVVLPPTLDREAARESLAQLQLGTGTAIGEAVERALAVARPQRANGEPAPAAVLLLSDGAQTAGGPRPLDAAGKARKLGIPVSTVALGTSGAVVEVPRGNGVVERVTVPPDPDTLRAIASTSGGAFYEVADAERLEQVYAELGTRLARESRREEVTRAFAAAGAALLLVAAALSTAWFGRAL